MTNILKAKNLILKAGSAAIFSHSKPDGDAIGSCLALKNILEQQGKRADIFLQNCDSKYAFLKGFPQIKSSFSGNYDIAIAMDCADIDRLEVFQSDFMSIKNSVCVDHHFTNGGFANVNIIDSKMSSTCELLCNVFEQWEMEIDLTVAECLFCGLVTDSGLFSHSNVTAGTFATAAKLVGKNIDAHSVIKQGFKNKSKNKFDLMMRVLSKTRYFCDGKIAVITFLKDDFAKTQTDIFQTEGIIENLMEIDSVFAAVSVCQILNNSYKVSMRCIKDVDVSSACSDFGGGGHKNAAGCVINGFYEDVVEKAVNAIVRNNYERFS